MLKTIVALEECLSSCLAHRSKVILQDSTHLFVCVSAYAFCQHACSSVCLPMLPVSTPVRLCDCLFFLSARLFVCVSACASCQHACSSVCLPILPVSMPVRLCAFVSVFIFNVFICLVWFSASIVTLSKNILCETLNAWFLFTLHLHTRNNVVCFLLCFCFCFLCWCTSTNNSVLMHWY